jgi:hypothetical protein
MFLVASQRTIRPDGLSEARAHHGMGWANFACFFGINSFVCVKKRAKFFRPAFAGHRGTRTPSEVTYVYQGNIEKVPILEEILKDAKIESSEVAYVGDDLTDAVIMRRVGLAIANARDEVKRAAHYVTQARGGEGAVREVVELLLKAQNLWKEILRHYELEQRSDGVQHASTWHRP